jgi:hypothetical protein
VTGWVGSQIYLGGREGGREAVIYTSTGGPWTRHDVKNPWWGVEPFQRKDKTAKAVPVATRHFYLVEPKELGPHPTQCPVRSSWPVGPLAVHRGIGNCTGLESWAPPASRPAAFFFFSFSFCFSILWCSLAEVTIIHTYDDLARFGDIKIWK